MFRLLIILPCLFLKFQPLNAKVEAPNYKFDPKSLEIFYPGKTIDPIITKFGKGESLGVTKGIETIKFTVKEKQYLFTVLVQTSEGIIQDFLAKLPSYFSHDVFFEDLRKTLGKQDIYKRTQEEAFYQWNKEKISYVYSASCTITCFPVFFSGFQKENKDQSILGKMKKANSP